MGQDGILRADGIGAVRTVLLIGNRPVDNRLQDAILPHCQLRSIPGRLAGVILKECQATKTNLRKLSIS